MNLFGNIKIVFPMTPNYNFSEIGNSLISLFILSTGDNFQQTLAALSRENSL